MGPCQSGWGILLCPVTSSFYNSAFNDAKLNLPALGAESNTITASGWSGGCTTAGNLNVVFSEYVKGVGLYQGGPYGDWFSQGHNVDPTTLAQTSIDLANTLASESLIDSTSNLNGAPVFIASGA